MSSLPNRSMTPSCRAMPAYPSAFGTTNAVTVNPAIRSGRSQRRSYRGAQPNRGRSGQPNSGPCDWGVIFPSPSLSPW